MNHEQNITTNVPFLFFFFFSHSACRSFLSPAFINLDISSHIPFLHAMWVGQMSSGFGAGIALGSSKFLGQPKISIRPTLLSRRWGFWVHTIDILSLPSADASIFRLIGRKIVDIGGFHFRHCCKDLVAIGIFFLFLFWRWEIVTRRYITRSWRNWWEIGNWRRRPLSASWRSARTRRFRYRRTAVTFLRFLLRWKGRIPLVWTIIVKTSR